MTDLDYDREDRGTNPKRKCRPGCTACDNGRKTRTDLRCDVHEQIDPECWRECSGHGRCVKCQRYAFLCFYKGRNDAEEIEVQTIAKWILSCGQELPWPLEKREQTLTGRSNVVK